MRSPQSPMVPLLLVVKGQQNIAQATQKILDDLHISPFDIQYIEPGTQLEQAKRKTVQEKSIGVQTIKQLREKAYLSSTQGLLRAIVIKKAQLLTTEAQNALLKILEEPPDHLIFLLVSASADELLPTIVSRCKVVKVSEDIKEESLEQDAKLQKLHNMLSTMTHAQALSLAESLAKDKDDLLPTLERLILFTRSQLLKNLSDEESLRRNSAIVQLLQYAWTLLKQTNANPRLTLEVLFLKITTNEKD